MNLNTIFGLVSEYSLFVSGIFLLLGSIVLTFKLGFVQLRIFPAIVRIIRESFKNRSIQDESHTVAPYKALFTAMSTTLGIGTMVAPVIAVHMGGPGALLGFLLTAFFGSAATYLEVDLSLRYRKTLADGTVMGGPMQYLRYLMSASTAKYYAFCGFLLMIVWSGAQSNQLAAILNSPLLGDYRIPKILTGTTTAILVVFLLCGGIKRVGSFSAKLVPVMFCLYVGSSLWILLHNLDKLESVFSQIFSSIYSPYQMAGGALVGGLISSLRWGIFKGIHATEAGVGTQSIPHSMSQTDDASYQGMIAMISTFSAGLISFMSGCIALLTKTWEDPNLPLGMSMVAASFEAYFSWFGLVIISIAAPLFAFGTILGNGYNGSQCFNFLTQNKKTSYYYAGTAIMIIVGSLADVKIVWSLSDLVLAAITLPHMTALLLHAFKKRSGFNYS